MRTTGSFSLTTGEPVKAGPGKKKYGFKDLLYDAAGCKGFSKLNVLVIGDLKGKYAFALSGANVVYFTDTERSRRNVKPIGRLPEYADLLNGKFDIVASEKLDAGYLRYLSTYGVYITKTKDSAQADTGVYSTDAPWAFIPAWQDGKETCCGGEFKERLLSAVEYAVLYSRGEHIYIPDIDKVFRVPVDDRVTLTHRGLKESPATAGLLELYNRTLSVYNPLYTTYTGIIDAFHKFPSTAFVEFDERLGQIESLGFDAAELPAARALSERHRGKYAFLVTPLMPLMPQQTLAYVKEKEYTARVSIPRLGLRKGKKYGIRVGWKKRRDGRFKRGFMTVIVNGHTLYEDSEEDVDDFVKAFGLPKVGSVEDVRPECVELWRKKAKKEFPRLLDFQIEDVALAATKPFVYMAHDRGMGKTLMAACWARLRGYRRVMVAAHGQYLDKWRAELRRFGFRTEDLLDWKAVRRLKERIKAGIKPDETTFYLCSFEFLSLESDIRMDPWTCVEKDDKGYVQAVVQGIRTRKCPNCGKTAGQARNTCPLCGSGEYTGRFCYSCRRPTYAYRRPNPLTPGKCAAIEHEAKLGRNGFHSGTYPAYRKLKKLFKCVIVDEAQMVKNKNTLRSTAVRSLHAKGKALVTANLMKNYPNELFWPVGWLLGFNNPMFPYRYTGGYPFFERQFGTQVFKGMHPSVEGKEVWERTPEVSNLSILWKLMAPFMVRRLKTDIDYIPPKEIYEVVVDMDEDQARLYEAVRQSKLEELARELLKANPDAKVIGANLWSLKAASTIPVAKRYFPQIDVSYSGSWEKLEWIAGKVAEIAGKGEKALVFSTLVDMADCVHETLRKRGIGSLRIRQGTKNRFEAIKRFNSDSTTALVSSMELVGKCYDIDGASHVIFADMGWTPEEHEQAMDRALRLTSTKPVEVYFLLSRGTIDEHMYELVLQKGEAIKNVLDRRPVYKTAEVLKEAVQVRVARKLIKERPVASAGPARKPAEEEKTVRWPAAMPLPTVCEQMDLF